MGHGMWHFLRTPVCWCICDSLPSMVNPWPGGQGGMGSQYSQLVGEHCSPSLHTHGTGAIGFGGRSGLKPFPEVQREVMRCCSIRNMTRHIKQKPVLSLQKRMKVTKWKGLSNLILFKVYPITNNLSTISQWSIMALQVFVLRCKGEN